jgi:hypothetical protein
MPCGVPDGGLDEMTLKIKPNNAFDAKKAILFLTSCKSLDSITLPPTRGIFISRPERPDDIRRLSARLVFSPGPASPSCSRAAPPTVRVIVDAGVARRIRR